MDFNLILNFAKLASRIIERGLFHGTLEVVGGCVRMKLNISFPGPDAGNSLKWTRNTNSQTVPFMRSI